MGFFSHLFHQDQVEGTKKYVAISGMVCQNCVKHVTEALKDVDTTLLKGQLLYAVSADDEVAPAQALSTFAKSHDALKLVGAISAEGALLGTDEVKALASLPSKNELIAQVLATLSSPLDGVMGGLSGDLHGLLDGVATKAS